MGLVARTSRQEGAKSTLGADIVISLPPEFDGALRVIQDNGSTDIQFAGAASSVDVMSDNGSCQAHTGSAKIVTVESSLSKNLSGLTSRCLVGRINRRPAVAGRNFSWKASASSQRSSAARLTGLVGMGPPAPLETLKTGHPQR